jgi:hypothetical protein
MESISTLDPQNYKSKFQGAYGSVYRLNLHISIMKAMFHWARRNDILDCHQMVFDAFAEPGYRIAEMFGNLNFLDACPRNPANVLARVGLTASLPLV